MNEKCWEIELQGKRRNKGGESMKSYIFVTGEGNTETPSGEEIDNIQVLGFEIGKNEDEAYKNFLEEYKYLLETSFDDVICIELKELNYWDKCKRFSLEEVRKVI